MQELAVLISKLAKQLENLVDELKRQMTDKWNPPPIGSKARERMPASYFLLPKEKKFPYRDPKTGKVSCEGLRAAMRRAAQHGYQQVLAKAKRLYARYCKKNGK